MWPQALFAAHYSNVILTIELLLSTWVFSVASIITASECFRNEQLTILWTGSLPVCQHFSCTAELKSGHSAPDFKRMQHKEIITSILLKCWLSSCQCILYIVGTHLQEAVLLIYVHLVHQDYLSSFSSILHICCLASQA